MEKQTISQRIARWRLKHWFFGAGSALALLLAGAILFGYGMPSDMSATQTVRAMLPLPVATVGFGSAASFSELAENLASVRRFYETQDLASIGMRIDFTTEEGEMRLKMREKEILNKMIEDEALKILSEADGIFVSSDEATKEVARQLEKVGGKEENMRERLSRLYGWDVETFKEKVVLPDLYERELRIRFESDASQFSLARSKAEEAKTRLGDGRSFSDVAAEFSEGRSAAKGGAMGWFSYPDLIAELQEAAKSQKIGEVGPIIESPLGFHIMLINERKTEKGKEYVSLSQIFLKKKTFGEWLSEKMRDMDIRVFAPEYEWNRETAEVEFSSQTLRDFERKALEQSEGDASVF